MIWFLTVFLLLASLTAGADTQVPHTFVDGTAAKAAEVNANFDALESAIDALPTRSISIDPLSLAGSDTDVNVDFVVAGSSFRSHALALKIGASGDTSISPTFEFGITVPPDYTTNSPIDVVFKWISEATNCEMGLQVNYLNALTSAGSVLLYPVDGEGGPFEIGASSNVLHISTFRLLVGQDYLDAAGNDSPFYPDGYDGPDLVAGSVVNLGFYRSPFDNNDGGPDDTCRESGTLGIVGINVDYS